MVGQFKALSQEDCKRLLDLAIEHNLYDKDPDHEGYIFVTVRNDPNFKDGLYAMDIPSVADSLFDDPKGQNILIDDLKTIGVIFKPTDAEKDSVNLEK